jgi:hypothetical protein
MRLFLFAAVCSRAAAVSTRWLVLSCVVLPPANSPALLLHQLISAFFRETQYFNLFPDKDLTLRQPVHALDPIDHINSNDVDDTDSCPDIFVAGTSYEEGDLVELNTVVYKCKSWPYAPWCSKSGYEPDGDNSDKAWEVIGHCEEELIDPVVPSVVKVENERMLETTLPGCPALHNPSNTYAVGDQVSITSGQSSIVYQCDNGTNCNQNSPGSGSGWTLVGYCEGTIAPTSSPTTVSRAKVFVMTAQIVYTLSIITNIFFAFVNKGTDDRKSDKGTDDRKSIEGTDDRKSDKGTDDRKSIEGTDDRKSDKGTDDRKSDKGTDDRKSDKGSDDRKSNQKPHHEFTNRSSCLR